MRTEPGEIEVFAGMYDLLAPRVYQLAVLITADTGRAGRVTQTVFSDLLDAMDRGVLSSPREARRFTERRVLHHAGISPHASGTQSAVLEDLRGLTELQRRCIGLAHRGARTVDHIARLLHVECPVVNKAIRDGLAAMSPTPTADRR